MARNKSKAKEDNEITLEYSQRVGQEILSTFKEAQTFVATREEDLVENLAFYEGTQYRLSHYANSKRPWVVKMNTPHAKEAIDIRVASLIADDYVGELKPYSSSSVEGVETLGKIYADVWREMEADDLVTRAIEKAAVLREGYVHIFVDDNIARNKTSLKLKGDILDTTSVYLDPNARRFQDCEYIIITGRITPNKAKATYSVYDAYKEYARYSGSPEDRGELNVGNDYVTSQEKILNIITKYNKVYEEKNKVKITKQVVIGGILVEERTIEGLTQFPIAQLRWRAAEQSAYGISLMDDIISIQKAINSIESSMTNSAIVNNNPATIVSSSSGLDPRVVASTSGAPGIVFKVNGPARDAMEILRPPLVDAQAVALKEKFADDMTKIAGSTANFTGVLGTAGNTAGGASLAVERSKVVEIKIFKNIKDFVENLTEIVIDYIKFWYDKKGELVETRTVDGYGNVQFNEYEMPSVENLDYSFYIEVDKRTAFSKAREGELLLQLYQYERQYDTPVKVVTELDIMKSMGFTNIEELTKRYQSMQVNTNQEKVKVISELDRIAQTLQIDPSLIEQAKLELLDDTDTKKEVLTQVITLGQQQARVLAQKTEQANQQALQMGIPQEAIDQVAEQGVTLGDFEPNQAL